MKYGEPAHFMGNHIQPAALDLRPMTLLPKVVRETVVNVSNIFVSLACELYFCVASNLPDQT